MAQVVEPDAESQTVVIRGIGTTSHFLAGHPDLTGSLVQAVGVVARTIPGLGQVTLDVFAEPESGAEYLRLVVSAHTYDEALLESLQAANRELRQRLGATAEHLFVTTDFEAMQ